MRTNGLRRGPARTPEHGGARGHIVPDWWSPRPRWILQAAVDAVAWTVALLLAWGLYADVGDPPWEPGRLTTLIVIAAGVQILVGAAAGLHTGRWYVGSFEELSGLGVVTLATGAVVLMVNAVWVSDRPLTNGLVVTAAVTAGLLTGSVRWGRRMWVAHLRRPSSASTAPVIVFGAGEGGRQLIDAMTRDPNSPYIPVALLDDDSAKRNLQLRGVPVLGDRHALPAVADECGASTVVFAIPSAGRDLVSAVTDLANEAGLSVKVLPAVRDLLGGTVRLSDVRDVDVEDLIGRHEIHVTDETVDYVTGQRVLVTGAGGSIGGELCRQISRLRPAELLMLDRDESALHAVELSIEGRALLDRDGLLLADVRDADVMRRILEQCRPDVVFHAAALKHLPLLERYPGEGYRTNVLGTLNVLDAAVAAGVRRFVNISTDKAADPVSVLGYTKRIAERLTAAVAERTGLSYVSVRFGNVLGSRGSALETFLRQIDAGGPVTVTHPQVTRYFMTTGEAVELVVQAGAIGRPGEVLVLDMGEPVRITELVRRLIGQSERRVQIVYTGLRPGEKLEEALFGAGERDERPLHPQIAQTPVPPLEPGEALRVDVAQPSQALVEVMRDLCSVPDRRSVRERDNVEG